MSIGNSQHTVCLLKIRFTVKIGLQDDATTPLRRVGERLRGLVTSEERGVDEINIDTYHHFPEISDNRVSTAASANGYVSSCETDKELQPEC